MDGRMDGQMNGYHSQGCADQQRAPHLDCSRADVQTSFADPVYDFTAVVYSLQYLGYQIVQ